MNTNGRYENRSLIKPTRVALSTARRAKGKFLLSVGFIAGRCRSDRVCGDVRDIHSQWTMQEEGRIR
jgi:hypothetical protein